jgi:SAM-dependent methyltransferase
VTDWRALLAEAEAAPVDGWAFGWMKGRSVITGPAWDFTALVGDALAGADAALDMGTGGGEWLASWPRRAALMVATEAWEPNVAVAAARLRPLGVVVVREEGAPDNFVQDEVVGAVRGRLPFRPAAFDVVVNRHDAFVAREVARVLRPGGQFLTQQAGTACDQFHELLGAPAPDVEEFHLSLAIEQVESAGLTVVDSAQGEERITFGDVGVFARYLRQVPWALPGFTTDRYRDELARLHETARPIEVAQERFWLRAVKAAPRLRLTS